MKSTIIFFSWFLLSTLFMNLGESYLDLSASIPNSPNQTRNQRIAVDHFQEPTPAPDITTETTNIEYPLARNPGLVFGAIILVLIILGGVIINSRFFKKK